MKVLIAEDDGLVRSALRLTLSDAGFEPLEAADGIEAIEVWETQAPALIILDLMMPRANGYDVLRRLRLVDPDCTTKVVILSAFIAEADNFLDFPHVIDVLQKPVYLEQLLCLLRSQRPTEPTEPFDPTEVVRGWTS